MACSGRSGRSSLSYFQSPTAPNRIGVGFLGQLQRGVGQRVAVRLVGGAADQGGFHLELQVERVEHLDGLGDDFGADAVTGKDCDFHDLVFCDSMRGG